MIAAIRAELRKLLTVRSTYVITILCLLIVIFMAFFIEGYSQVNDIANPGHLASQMVGAATLLALLISLVGFLLMTHEYRYNTIMYSLTAASSRTHVLLAKMIVVSIYSILLTALVTGIAPLLTKLGMAVRGVDLAAQNLPFMDIWLHAIFYGWAFSMLALLIAAIVRSQVGTLAILLLFPVLGESLLSLLLKENAKYLPFTALGQVLQSAIPGQLRGVMLNLSGTQAILVVLAYIAGLGLLAWLLFRRRDAN